LTGAKLHSPIPHFLATALMGLVPVLNNQYPAQFFPALSPWGVEVVSVFLGVVFAFWGFNRGWLILQRRALARELIRQAVASRHADPIADVNEVNNAGRLITRLVRNTDGDLAEIKPDFSTPSLKRLQRYLPVILEEIETEEGARIRLGVIGVYLGETACRNNGWQWFFQTDTSLRQFGYLASIIRKANQERDVFGWAGDLLAGKKKIGDWLEEMK
jgi:hypothetical protein